MLLWRSFCFSQNWMDDSAYWCGFGWGLRFIISNVLGSCLQLGSVDFELDSKIVVNSLYGSKSGVSNFSAVINDCKPLLASDLVTSNVRFIRRQANEVAHSFAKVASRHTRFHIHIRITSCICTIIMNEMQ